MNRHIRIAPGWQILLAGVAGTLAGNYLGTFRRLPPLVLLCRELAEAASGFVLAWTYALAVPLILSSLMLGAVGLEPMRSLGRVVRKTLGWAAVSGLVAVLIGLGAAFVVPVPWELNGGDFPMPERAFRTLSYPRPPSWTWVPVVLLGLGFAYYRNQIEEGHGRLIARFFQGIDEMLGPLLQWTARFAPWGIFVMLVSAASQPRQEGTTQTQAYLGYLCESLLLGWAVFGLIAVPTALWVFARINPWRYFVALLPALGAGMASSSPESALPLTMQAVRRQAHVSNRVAGVVLSLGAVLQREGLALGYVVSITCAWRSHDGMDQDWTNYLGLVISMAVFAVGAGVLGLQQSAGVASMTSLVFLQHHPQLIYAGWVVGALASMGGAALSVWSQACAAMVIARSEGEYWVPGPPPSPDELQGLKADLDSAEG